MCFRTSTVRLQPDGVTGLASFRLAVPLVVRAGAKWPSGSHHPDIQLLSFSGAAGALGSTPAQSVVGDCIYVFYLRVWRRRGGKRERG